MTTQNTKLNATQIAIVKAIETFKQGSRGIVTVYENVLADYWGKDSCNPDNIQFMLNALKRFPQIQRIAKNLLTEWTPEKAITIQKEIDGKMQDVKVTGFGNFKIKSTRSGTDVTYTVVNHEDGMTKQEKAAFRSYTKSFAALELTSLMHEKKTAAIIDKAFTFDKEKSAKAMRQAIQRQVEDFFKANPAADPSMMRAIVGKTLDDVFNSENIKTTREKVKETLAKKAA